MKSFAIIAATAAALPMFAASSASADIMVGSPGESWRAFPAPLNNYGNVNRPYWDQQSVDGANANIGNFLKGPFSTERTGAVASPNGGMTPDWWGAATAASSNFDLNMHFNRGDSAGPITATMVLKDTALATTVGWYDADNPTNKTTLWTGSPAIGSQVLFTPTANWGFFLVCSQGTYYMNSSLNSTDKVSSHFAALRWDTTDGAEGYFVGIEDTGHTTTNIEGIGDFQDFVISFQSTPGGGTGVPEPSSLCLLAASSGLLLRRKR